MHVHFPSFISRKTDPNLSFDILPLFPVSSLSLNRLRNPPLLLEMGPSRFPGAVPGSGERTRPSFCRFGILGGLKKEIRFRSGFYTPLCWSTSGLSPTGPTRTGFEPTNLNFEPHFTAHPHPFAPCSTF